MLRYLVAIGTLVMVAVSAAHSDACEMVAVRKGLPRPGSTLALGVVVGYGTVAHPVPAVEVAPSLRVRIENVVSGNTAVGATDVVPLFYAADCTSTPIERARLQSAFPVGTTIAISTGARSDRSTDSPSAIVAELNQDQFVVTVPANVRRTRDGDLDFEHSEPSWQLGEFEFDRAVMGLRRADRSDKLPRLMNLAHYSGFRDDRRGKEWLEQLIAESGLSASERAEVMSAAYVRR